ncbi:TetR/AcrR family transcriptional regulator [Candidatus Binatus sp.]|uniref:TetR/AcrR family transcriptional regulator n=1 Tax=Candidatus Binatus sp. TaxID=2811406 RepID=UPI002F949F6D
MNIDTPTREQTDGRRQRSEASRERIVRAMLELVGAGEVTPSAEAVAARAGVGLRTVFRHFDNMESLYQQIDAVMTAEIRPMVERPFAAGEWKAQLGELIERRIRIFERIMPFKIAADAHRHHSPFLASQGAEMTREQRAELSRLVPRGKRDNALFFEGLDLVLSFESWRRMRKDQKLSLPRARHVLERLVGALLKAD